MNKWIESKLPLAYLFWALIILIIGLLIIEQTKFSVKTTYYDERMKAAQLMKTSLGVIKEERLKKIFH